MKTVLTPFFFCGCLVAHSQDMYKALKQEHSAYRFGIGLQALEPSGVNIQMFHGFFCSNSDTYATKGVWELAAGLENSVLTSSGVKYKDGVWKKGGTRIELNYLYPVFTLDWNIVFQTYIGAGLQTGSRHYDNALGEQTSGATGGNLLLRFEFGGQGFEAGNSLLFFSVFADAKLHKEFGEDFSYFKPSVGIHIRKAR